VRCAAEFWSLSGHGGQRTSRAVSDPLPRQVHRAGTHKHAVSANSRQLDDGEVYLHATLHDLFGSIGLMAVGFDFASDLF